MSRKKILVVGFDEEGEKMYPHTYDWLKFLRQHHDITYYGNDDKGFNFYLKDQELEQINKLLNRSKYKKTEQWYDEKINAISLEIKALFKEHFDVVIAMDHSALFHTCKFINKKKSKLIFWSYDIICNDHPWLITSTSIRSMIDANRKNINLVDHIIVQDYFRGIVLDASIFSHQISKTYIPVSLFDDELSKNIATKKSENNFKNELPVLIQVGSINSARNSDKLILETNKLKKYRLNLLGHVSKEINQLAAEVDYKPTCFPVQEQLSEMRKLIATADIGILSINQPNLNNHFYAKASGQMVEFMKYGMPVIGINHHELNSFINTNKIGQSLSFMDELDEKIEKIRMNYSEFSNNCRKIYNEYFNLSNYTNQLLQLI